MLQLNFDNFPILSTKNLVLRRIRNDDAKDLLKLRSDKALMQYISRPLTESVDDVFKLIKIIDDSLNNTDGVTWAITLKNDNKLVGTIGYWKIEKEHYRAEIGYLLAPALHGKGVMSEAISTVLSYGFESLKLHSVEAVVDPGNLASAKLLVRNNFIKEASFKENFYFEGDFKDSDVYSLLTNIH